MDKIKSVPTPNTRIETNAQRLFESLPSVRRFKKGEMIYLQGETAKSFCYLKCGFVKVFMTSVDGLEKTLNTASKGELFGEGAFFDRLPRVSSAVAETNCEVVMIDRATLSSLFEKNMWLAFELLEVISNRVRMLSSQLDSMTFLQADERVSRVLAQNAEDGIVRLSHEEIAEAIGTSRVTVSKILSRFSKRGLLKTEYRKITLNNAFYEQFSGSLI